MIPGEAFIPDSAIEGCLGSLGRPVRPSSRQAFRSEANGLVALSRQAWPVRAVAFAKQAR